MAAAKIKMVLKEQFRYATKPGHIIQIKYATILFCRSVHNYSSYGIYNVQPFNDFLGATRERFERLLFKDLANHIVKVMYVCMYVCMCRICILVYVCVYSCMYVHVVSYSYTHILIYSYTHILIYSYTHIFI